LPALRFSPVRGTGPTIQLIFFVGILYIQIAQKNTHFASSADHKSLIVSAKILEVCGL